MMHIPPLFEFLAIATEFFAASLIFGFLTQIAALGILSNMIVAAAMAHIAGLGTWQSIQDAIISSVAT